jgi:class 3 adenylate cyclase/predicted ATPase
MSFEEILDQALAMLQRRGRVSYRALQRQFALDDAYLEDVKAELLYAYPQVSDDQGRGLIWTGDIAVVPESASSPPVIPQPPPSREDQHVQPPSPPAIPPSSEAERRQLTVLFCDLVDSTALAGRLDPEDLRAIVRAYQAACAEVIRHFEGHIAQYLGDGLLVYFGYPQAHEDDTSRAVRTGLGIVEGIRALNTRLQQEQKIQLAVRIGIHTGLVVVGEIGSGGRQEQLALGETPNIAARLQSLATPDTVVISEATARLIEGYFVCQTLGAQEFKGLAQPMRVYQVLHESGTQTRLDVAAIQGLTPLVGREQEVGLLLERWTQVKDGLGQLVLLSGEAGVGKSRLVQVLTARLAGEAHTRIECRCTSRTQHSALYPVITHLERALAFARDDTLEAKLHKLEAALAQYTFPLLEIVPLFAALLSLPLPAQYPPLTLTPQRQRQQTLEALVAWLMQETERCPVLFIVEDLHWVDPSTLELLTLLLDQIPTIRLLTLLTCRPEFVALWTQRAYLTQLTMGRLGRSQVEAMVTEVLHGKTLPAEVLRQVVAKTDGVPLFVEELTKTVLESGLLREQESSYELTGPLPPLAIPATLHDSLMARLDRLTTVKAVAQLGATIGRQFSYDLLQEIATLDEAALQHGLRQLVEAELVYQRGVGSQALYTFKHALIQDAAYQSLLRSTRQQYHQRIAQVLEQRFPETVETQPELLAQHYTEAGLIEQAIPYWQRAGQHASDRSAHQEAVSHFTTGIELLKTLPETPAHAQQALTLWIALGAALLMTKGQGAPEVKHAFTQAHALCQQAGETPELVPVLFGLWRFYTVQPQLHTAREIGETLLRLAQHAEDPALAVIAHYALGLTWCWFGVWPAARLHLEEGIARYTPDLRQAQVFRIGQDLGAGCRLYAALTLWFLGYPAQALARAHEALALAHDLSHPFTLAWAQSFGAMAYHMRRDVTAVYEHTEAAVVLATDQGFPLWGAVGMCGRGWALAMQGQGEEGIAQIHEGMAALRATGAAILVPWFCILLAEVADRFGYTEEGLQALAEAHTLMEQHEERWWEAEIYRLRGALLLRQPGTPQAEAEACFQRALDVARRQEAKSLELRAAMSLARLWQRQGNRTKAYDLLAPIYGWFTEGFDTADLQEAKALLEALG